MKSMKKLLLVAILLAVVVVSVGSCSAGWFDFLNGGNSTDTSLDGQEVNLAAAASLKNVFDDKLIPMFEEKYPGVTVTPNYAAPGNLQTQMENGLEADVFISASNKEMDALVEEGIIDNDTNVQYLENKVVLIVPADSDSNISSFEDLKDVDGEIVIANPDAAPLGRHAKEIFTNLGIWEDVESKLSIGTDVQDILNQVSQHSGECGIVFATDAKARDDVKLVCEAPEDALKTKIIYPVAITANAANPDAAQVFIDFLQTPEAQDVFVDYGFIIHEE
jgi:molybdate transport system substrate-binding protein